MRLKPNNIVRIYKENGNSEIKTSLLLGIHKSTVYRWIKRATRPDGYITERNLKRLSTKPHTIHYALSTKDRQAILNLRTRKGYTAIKIKSQLGLKASVSTVHRMLKANGLVKPYSRYRRPRFQDTFHMHAKNTTTVGYLQMDVKVVTPELSGLPWTCFEYAVIDIYSRYKEAVILNQLDQNGAMAALLEILPKLPFKPLFIQTDNGLEFQARFLSLCESIGLKHHFIHKSTPNENAIIERSFRTDEEEFYFRLKTRPKHYDELRELFATYLHEYNHERLHLGINLLTPSQKVAEVVID